jgi:hypothetical protein
MPCSPSSGTDSSAPRLAFRPSFDLRHVRAPTQEVGQERLDLAWLCFLVQDLVQDAVLGQGRRQVNGDGLKFRVSWLHALCQCCHFDARVVVCILMCIQLHVGAHGWLAKVDIGPREVVIAILHGTSLDTPAPDHLG